MLVEHSFLFALLILPKYILSQIRFSKRRKEEYVNTLELKRINHLQVALHLQHFHKEIKRFYARLISIFSQQTQTGKCKAYNYPALKEKQLYMMQYFLCIKYFTCNNFKHAFSTWQCFDFYTIASFWLFAIVSWK